MISKSFIWRIACVVLLLVTFTASGCDVTSESPYVEILDSDGDGISDDVEVELGLDPNNGDSDGDGLSDLYELLLNSDGGNIPAPRVEASTSSNGAESNGGMLDIPDADGDGIISALDADDNGDDIHDGLDDADGDGIPNAYEYYGYSIEGFNRDLQPWGVVVNRDRRTHREQVVVKNASELDYNAQYFKTNPLQASTDGDPYGDLFESQGINMDQAIVPPGNNPSIPAFPQFYVAMDSYSVTMVESVQSNFGGKNSWTNTVSTSSQAGECEGLSFLDKVKFGGIIRGAICKILEPNVNTNNVSKSNSGEEDWSTVRSTETDAAAKIKMNLKVFNFGTAPAYNVSPTVSLYLGSKAIATFSTATSINALGAGSEYPDGAGNFWNVDKRGGTGNASTDITLSMDELKCFETGSPFSLGVTQTSATMKLPIWDEELQVNVYQDIGPWSDYSTSLEKVSAQVVIDAGDGHYSNHLVFARDPGKNSPPITIRDALYWTLGDYEGGSFQGYKLTMPDGTYPIALDLNQSEWAIILDSHYIATDFTQDPLDVKLKPQSVVYIKAVPSNEDAAKPPIQWATMSPLPVAGQPTSVDAITDQYEKSVAAFVTDYYEVSEVYMLPSIGSSADDKYVMTDDDRDSIYTTTLPASYVPNGSEVVIATNIDGLSSQIDVSISAPVGTTHQLQGSRNNKNSGFDIDNGTQGNTCGDAYKSFQGWDLEVYLIKYKKEGYWKSWIFTGLPAAFFEFGPTQSYDALTYTALKDRYDELSKNFNKERSALTVGDFDMWPYWHYNSHDTITYWMVLHPFYFNKGTTFGLITDEGNFAKVRIDDWTSTYDKSWPGWNCNEVYITYMIFRDIK